MRKVTAMIVLAIWLPSMIMGLAGLQTIVWWKDTGEGNPWQGIALTLCCGVFLLVASRLNGHDLSDAMDTYMRWFDMVFSFRLRLRARLRWLRMRIQRDRGLCQEWEENENKVAVKA